MWCGPPLELFDDGRAAAIAAAGFTDVGPPCEGGRSRELNLRALDVAARHGLRLWLADHRFGIRATEAADWRALRAAVADYRHPALGAYFVVDEPSAAAFPVVASIVAELRSAAPDRLAYVNLHPDYAPAAALGAPDYASYLDRFLAEVRPALLSYDYYPFREDGDRPSYFANLARIRDAAQASGLPFLVIVQAMPHGPYRDPEEGELAWQVFHALAHGARGISYFAYWTPVDVAGAERWRFRHGLVEHGRPTRHHGEAARLNRRARAIAAQLGVARSLGVVDSRGRFAPGPPLGPIASIDGGPVTVGWLRDEGGRSAALVVNQDPRRPTLVRLRYAAEAGAPRAFDPDTGCWRLAPDGQTFTLPPGAGRLLRW
jgi:hypothetical protein